MRSRPPTATRLPVFRWPKGRNIWCAAWDASTDLEAIRGVLVENVEGTPVFVRDVGAVREGAAIKRGEGSHNARPAVIIGIQKQPGVNTLELTERLEMTLDDIQRSLPAGMRIHRDLFRQADFIEQSLGNLFKAFIEGAALVIVVVLAVPDEHACRRDHLAGAAIVARRRGACHGPLRADAQQHESRRPGHCHR